MSSEQGQGNNKQMFVVIKYHVSKFMAGLEIRNFCSLSTLLVLIYIAIAYITDQLL